MVKERQIELEGFANAAEEYWISSRRDGLMFSAALEDLGRKLGDRMLVSPESLSAYSRDQCLMADAGTPIAVVRADSIEDVSLTLKVASEFSLPVVTRGAGTGLSGAANALDGCIVLSVASMDQILEVDASRRVAIVQPGVINADLSRATATHGLRYMPDPGSHEISTIGGNIATNAGGMSCCKYGVTADHVAGLKAVLPGGDLISTGGLTRKNVAGLDLTRLIVGSEGTLAVVVEATVWLQPTTDSVSTVVAMFDHVDSAIDAVIAITRATTPAAVELMDKTTISAVNAMTKMQIDSAAEAVLLLVFEGESASASAKTCESIAYASGASDVIGTDDVREGIELMTARRAALPALEMMGTTLLDDVAVPVDQLGAMISNIQQIARSCDVMIGTFGHAADGNLHPTIVFDAQKSSERARAKTAFSKIVDVAIQLGGTISGEHGIGMLKLPYMSKMYTPAELALMHRVKSAFDPQNLMNPGRAY